jgi:hypothetical protein
MPTQNWGLTDEPPRQSDEKKQAGLTSAEVFAKPDLYVNLGEVQMKYGDDGRAGAPHGDPKPDVDREAGRNVVDLTDLENERKSPLESGTTDQIDQPTSEGTPATRKGNLPLKQD